MKIKDIGENNFWLLFWLMTFTFLGSTITFCVRYYVDAQARIYEKAIDQGYEQGTIPGEHGVHWIKKEENNGRQSNFN